MAVLKRNRLFCNKIWQVTRFLFLLLDETSPKTNSNEIDLPEDSINSFLINQWIMNGLDKMVSEVNNAMSRYDFHHATDALYTFLYGSLCDVYLEAIKPLTGVEKQNCARVLAMCLDVSLRCLSPFMPFLSMFLYILCINIAFIKSFLYHLNR
jgi:valyl-tRNA synthetase